MSDSKHLEVNETSNTSILSEEKKCEIVAREDFNIELRKYYSGQSDKTKKPEWSLNRISQVIQSIEEYKLRKTQKLPTTNQQYHNVSKYEVLDVENEKILIMKRKTASAPVIEVVPSEKYYDILMELHIATRHGGRDKILQALKDKKIVPQFAVKLFLNLCKTCIIKRNLPKSDKVRPLVTNDFNRRGQMDLIDFQSTPDSDFKWLLNYRDSFTKFCFLRPLKCACASQIATELLKFFLEFGCPQILQSGNGREFTGTVIKEIMSLWPKCKILNGRPNNPQSQGSVEVSNQDVENVLKAWMKDNGSTNWSIGCYFVQFQMNTSMNDTIGKTPYKAVFGHEAIIGLASTNLPNNIIERLEKEEDLEISFGQNNEIAGTNNNEEIPIEVDPNEVNYDVCKVETVEHTFDDPEAGGSFVPANKNNMPEVNMFAVVQYITDNEKELTRLDYPKLKSLTKNNLQLLTSIKVLQTESSYRIRGTVNFDRVTSHMCEIEYNIQTDIITSSECVCGSSPCEHVAAFIMCLAHKPTNKQTEYREDTTRDTPQTSDGLSKGVKLNDGDDIQASKSTVTLSDGDDAGPSTSTVMTHRYNVELVDQPPAKRQRVSVETEEPVVPESSITVVPMPKDEDEPHKSKLMCSFARKAIYTMWQSTKGSCSERTQKIKTTLKQHLRDEEYIIDFSPIEQRAELLCTFFDKIKQNMNKSELTKYMKVEEVVELERYARNRNSSLRDPLS